MEDTKVLKKKIELYIKEKKETENFDIKLKWHDRPDELAKDIICFCNTVHDKDCYIVFGVDDKDFEIVGVAESNRRKQSDVIDLLCKLNFASSERPDIKVDTIFIENKELDVITIFNTKLTPLYLSLPYGNMKMGCIYSRVRDRNTENNGNSNFNLIEKLWKKRFGLTKTKKEIFYELIHEREDWTEIYPEYYNSYFPEYRINIEDEYENDRDRDEFYSYAVMNPQTSFYNINIQYKGALLDVFQGVSLDSGRLFIPIPEWGFIDNKDRFYETISMYKYYLKDSFRYRLLLFLFDKNNEEQEYAIRRFSEVVLIFENESEKEKFENYIKNNIEILISEKQKVDKYRYLSVDNLKLKNYQEKLQYGYALNMLLKRWRESD